MMDLKNYLIAEAHKSNRNKQEAEAYKKSLTILDSIKDNESNQELEEKVNKFCDFAKINGPCIYAFTTSDVDNAIKIGYTDQHPLKRIQQWEKSYRDVKPIGYWSASEINKIGEEVFFWDHEVHHKVENKGYLNVTKEDFYDKFASKTGKELGFGLHYSKEFFNKWKRLVNGEMSTDEKENLSEEILNDLLIEMKAAIKRGDNDFKIFKIGTHQKASEEWGSPQQYDNTDLQEKCVEEGVKGVNNKNIKNMLMSAVMRFGKTHASYDIVYRTGLKRIIVVSAKADVRNAWKEDINYKSWYKDFVFIEVRSEFTWDISAYNPKVDKIVTESKNVHNNLESEYKGKTIIFFFTLHDLAGSLEDIKKKHLKIFNNKFDMIIIDETHYGSHANSFGQVAGFVKKDKNIDPDFDASEYEEFERETKEVNKIKDSLDVKYDRMLQVSGTPYYILASNEFLDKKTSMIISKVSYTDMMAARDKWNVQHRDEDPSKSPYYGIPTLHKIGMRLTKECQDAIKDKGYVDGISALFTTKGNKFKYEKQVEDLMKTIFGDGSGKIAFLRNKKVEGNKICKHTIVVLPRIKACEVMRDLLKKFIKQDEREVICLVGNKPDVKDVKGLNEKLYTLDEHNKKSIILTVNKFLTGVSLPCVDSMIYLKSTSSSQEYDQNIFRLCTRYVKKVVGDDGPEVVNKKDNVYLIDFNIGNMFNMLVQSATMRANAEDNPSTENIEKIMKRDLEHMPLFCEKSDEISAQMTKVTKNDLMEAFAGYNKNKSIEDIADDDLNDLFSNDLFSKKGLQDALLDMDLKDFGGKTSKDKERLKALLNPSGDKSVNTKDLQDVDKDSDEDKETLTKTVKRNTDDAVNITKKLFKTLAKTLLYCNLCMDIPFNDFDDMIKSAKLDKEYSEILHDFDIDYKELERIRKVLSNQEVQSFNILLTKISLLTNDKSKGDFEKFTKVIEGLGKIQKSEVITPAEVVDKMVNKLDNSEYDKAKNILLINEKCGEFLQGLYKKFGEKILNKCKVIPSSMIGKQLTMKMLKSYKLDDYINIIVPMEDYNNNNRIEVTDFIHKTLDDKEMEKIAGTKHFDICLMNPPYDKNMHLRFMEKAFNILSKNGNLIYIGPDSWIINKYGFVEKSKLRNEYKEKYAKYIDDIEIIPAEDFNKYFGTSNWHGVSIFIMNHNAKGINPKDYEYNEDSVEIKLIKNIHDNFTSLRSHFSKRIDKEFFVPVRRTNHGYLNWVERDFSKINAKDGILFNSKEEMNNFIDSFDTWLYKFLNCTDWGGSENSASVPYLNNYKEKWTDEKLFKLFNISKDDQKYIKDKIKEKNPWNKK